MAGFGLPPDSFAKLAADCPALLTHGDVWTAGCSMLFFKVCQENRCVLLLEGQQRRWSQPARVQRWPLLGYSVVRASVPAQSMGWRNKDIAQRIIGACACARACVCVC